jgi:uncharacterized protein YecE (DUF72 family)
MPAKILIGTAGCSDPGFVRDWYPPRLRASERLPFYAQQFETVELNSSFYAISEQCLVEKWNRVTPPEFVFDVKLHKLFSRHYCELKMLPPDLQRLAKTTAKNRVIQPHLGSLIVDFVYNFGLSRRTSNLGLNPQGAQGVRLTIIGTKAAAPLRLSGQKGEDSESHISRVGFFL